MKEEKEIWNKLFLGLKFILYNDYEDLEEDLKSEYGEINTYIMNFIIGIFEYLKQHPDVAKYIRENYLF